MARAQREEEEARLKVHEAKLNLREQKIEGLLCLRFSAFYQLVKFYLHVIHKTQISVRAEQGFSFYHLP